jgi:hypothetical protein
MMSFADHNIDHRGDGVHHNFKVPPPTHIPIYPHRWLQFNTAIGETSTNTLGDASGNPIVPVGNKLFVTFTVGKVVGGVQHSKDIPARAIDTRTKDISSTKNRQQQTIPHSRNEASILHFASPQVPTTTI